MEKEMRYGKTKARRRRGFSKNRRRGIYIKYLGMLAAVLTVCVLLAHYAGNRGASAPGDEDGDYVRIAELAGYLQVIPLTPEETRALIVNRLEENTAGNPETGGADLSDTGDGNAALPDDSSYLTAADVEWLFAYLSLGELPETAAQELEAVGSGFVSRRTWCAVYEEMLAILGLQDEVETIEIQYLGMLLEDGHLMADSGNYECDTESLDFVYGGTYVVYVRGGVLLGRAVQEDAGDTGENGADAKESPDGEAGVIDVTLPETVRVLVTQDKGGNIYRENVYVKGEGELYISAPENGNGAGEAAETVAAGTVVDCLAWMDGHGVQEMTVSDNLPADEGDSATEEAAALTLAQSMAADSRISLTDSGGTAAASGYTGAFHIYRDENGLRVINVTSLEAYLCGVVPGEMPESFAAEALKAQAVCARTYAARLVSEETYALYGADFNDTTDCQVYVPSAENEKATEAVGATAGQVLVCDGALAAVYYFSTSCGLTSGPEVWQQGGCGYLTTVSLLADTALSGSVLGGLTSADEFLRRTDVAAYDSHSRYFRWTATLDAGSRLAELKTALQEEIAKGAGRVGVEDTSGTGIASVEELGGFSGMEVMSRSASGAVTDLALVFENGRVHLYHENVIRSVLGTAMTLLADKNGAVVYTMTMLPSAAFSVEASDGQITLYGGGLGHGIGMSQYGADGMAQAGMEYAEILGTFFPGTGLQTR